MALYDLRSQRPLVVKDHMYGSRIVDIKFHSYGADASAGSRRVISSDRHIIKVRQAVDSQAVVGWELRG